MEAEDRQDWNVFKQIFKGHWDGFKAKYPIYEDPYYNGLVEKMLNCGNPEQMGYIEYRCMSCGHGKRLVSMSCKSALCLRCGKVYVDDWVSQVSKMLLRRGNLSAYSTHSSGGIKEDILRSCTRVIRAALSVWAGVSR